MRYAFNALSAVRPITFIIQMPRSTASPIAARWLPSVSMRNILIIVAASCFEVKFMRKKDEQRKRTPLPPKPSSCSLCNYVSTLGPNDMQLHLDREHKGWAERVIRKMDIHVTGPAPKAPSEDLPKK